MIEDPLARERSIQRKTVSLIDRLRETVSGVLRFYAVGRDASIIKFASRESPEELELGLKFLHNGSQLSSYPQISLNRNNLEL